VRFRGTAQVNDFLPIARRDIIRFEGAREAWARAFDASGLSLADLSFAETHDCFTIAELIEYEAMGLAPEGQGARAALEKWYGKERAAKVQHAETFEIGEYGRRPSDEEIKRLFPMLGK
jgi:acetyl-CoA C-acetyltransferase